MATLLKKCAFLVLAFLLKIINIFCQIYSLKFHFIKAKLSSPVKNPLLLKPARQLSEEIRNKEITSESVVRAYICQIKDVNPILNAVIEERFETAIQEAQNVDKWLRDYDSSVHDIKLQRPLLGVPITIKGSLAVKNLSHCSGAVDLKDNKATKDADVVTLLKRSGAIVLLVSTTPEYCTSLETVNNITGITRNPYDTRRTPGGSSGGEAALIGSGASLIGIGSDFIGSIRVPACFCGIWGHKPSHNIVSLNGHIPISEDENFRYMLTVGPLCRYYTDLPLLLNAILEKDIKSSLLLNNPVDLKNVKVCFLEDYSSFRYSHKVETEIIVAIQRIVTHLQFTCLCLTQKIQLSKTGNVSDLFIEQLGSMKGITNLFENFAGNYFKELLLHVAGKSNHSFIHIGIGMLNSVYKYLRLPENSYEDLNELKNKLQSTLGANGVLIFPTHPTAANFHGEVNGKFYDYGYTAIVNILGFPATQCPIGLNSKGLPLGVQVIALTNNDRLTLRVAEEIDKIFGGWIPPSVAEEKRNHKYT